MAETNLLPQDKPNYTRDVLRAASTGVVLASAVIAPNLLRLLAHTIGTSTDKTLRAIRYAKNRGWITFRDIPGGVEVALTRSGRLRWQKIELDTPLYDERWDKKWRLVLFDIPIGLRQNAFAFRTALKRLGFKQIQQSVWLTPYHCETQIAFLRQSYNIKPFVRICEVSAIENEAELKTLFHLH